MIKNNVLLVVRHPVGGIRTFLKYFYRRLDPAKYSFTLIAPNFPEVGMLLVDLKDLDLTHIPTARDVSAWTLAGVVIRTLRGGGFDLVHSHGFTSGACSAVAALVARVPHIITCHDVFTPQQFTGVVGAVRRVALSMVLSLADAIHCVTEDARANLLEYLPILWIWRRKVQLIRHGIDTERFLNAERRDLKKELGLPEESFLIGFFGRFMSPKGFIYLIAALERLLQAPSKSLRRPVIVAVSQKDGFFREEINNVKRKGLSEFVYFLPFVADVASTLKGVDVVVMPSLSEACGLLAMEGMVAGAPLIGTNCGGLREVLQNTPAAIVPVKDGVALAEALAAEMLNSSVAKAASFAVKAAKRFDVERRAAELEELMQACISR